MNRIRAVPIPELPLMSWRDAMSCLDDVARRGGFDASLGRSARRRVDLLRARLEDRRAIERAGALPHAIHLARRRLDAAVPGVLRRALDRAVDHAIDNLPRFEGRVAVCPDVSASMVARRAGGRSGGYRRIETAALATMILVRNSAAAELLPFDDRVHELSCDPEEGIDGLALHLAALGGGGSRPAAALDRLNERQVEAELVVFVSDRSPLAAGGPEAAALLARWRRFKRRRPGARLVWLGLRAGGAGAAGPDGDRLALAGVCDRAFQRIHEFARGAGRAAAGG